MSWTDFLDGVALGGAIGAGVYVAARLWLGRVVRARRAHPANPAPTVDPPMPPPSEAPVSASGPPPEAIPGSILFAPAAPRPPPEVLAPPGSSASDPGSPARLSQRVLAHLARHGGHSPPDEAATQRGIMMALGVSQGALSSVLRRLEDGGAVASEKAHLRGRDRRVKVYSLTPRGRSLVPAPSRPPSGPPPPPMSRGAGLPPAAPAPEAL